MAVHHGRAAALKNKHSPAGAARATKIKLRVSVVDRLPARIRAIIAAYVDQTTEMVSFTIPQLPKSVNKQYFHTRWNTRLRPEVHAFRQLVSICMGAQRTKWAPRGTAAAILIFQSPNWITKDRTIRQHDLDNRVKPILDAVNAAAHGSDDCQYWDVLAFKMVGSSDQVFVMLFDLGDVVEYHQN